MDGADPIRRTEITHIDEVTRTARSTFQWFLEKPNPRGLAQPPVTHNNRLALFMCGQESFADIAEQIRLAKESIDICCWGFDPGMELVRNHPGCWPRGDTYGDLLIAAGKRGVKVRLLVWYDAVAKNTKNPRNLPGYTHDQQVWGASDRQNLEYARLMHARTSVARQKATFDDPIKCKFATEDPTKTNLIAQFPNRGELIAASAREEYCSSWFQAAFKGFLSGIEIRTRSGDADAVVKTLAGERQRPDATSAERNGMVHGATHHQKPILIDFYHEEGAKAVGYVMGLNSTTEYWDTAEHKLEDGLRESNGEKDAIEFKRGKRTDPGFRSYRPLHDYACRIEGRALVSLYNNFVKAWERADTSGKKNNKSELGSRGMPEALLRRAVPGESSVQIVRTQPEEGETSIRDIYCLAAGVATLACGYLYVENQYFQHEEWAQRLLETRERVITMWRAACTKAGKTMDDMPIMHVFVVIPVPELANMIPRTYDALAALGQQAAMTGQSKMIDEGNKPWAINLTPSWRDVLQHANHIEKPDPKTLEDRFGLKVCTAMLNTCGVQEGGWHYREVYIHSKLLMVDDCFLTLGSANLNMRSMAVDSEINIATCNPALARDLRRRIWAQHSGNAEDCDGGGGTRKELAKAFKNWKDLMSDNKLCQDKKQGLVGFLLPLEDPRSSFIRLG